MRRELSRSSRRSFAGVELRVIKDAGHFLSLERRMKSCAVIAFTLTPTEALVGRGGAGRTRAPSAGT